MQGKYERAVDELTTQVMGMDQRLWQLASAVEGVLEQALFLHNEPRWWGAGGGGRDYHFKIKLQGNDVRVIEGSQTRNMHQVSLAPDPGKTYKTVGGSWSASKKYWVLLTLTQSGDPDPNLEPNGVEVSAVLDMDLANYVDTDHGRNKVLILGSFETDGAGKPDPTTLDQCWTGGDTDDTLLLCDADVSNSQRKTLEMCPAEDAGEWAGQLYGVDELELDADWVPYFDHALSQLAWAYVDSSNAASGQKSLEVRAPEEEEEVAFLQIYGWDDADLWKVPYVGTGHEATYQWPVTWEGANPQTEQDDGFLTELVLVGYESPHGSCYIHFEIAAKYRPLTQNAQASLDIGAEVTPQVAQGIYIDVTGTNDHTHGGPGGLPGTEHTLLDFANSTPGQAGQNADHDSRYWIKGATYAENYGPSIGKTADTKVIDLTDCQLCVGTTVYLDWDGGSLTGTNWSVADGWYFSVLDDTTLASGGALRVTGGALIGERLKIDSDADADGAASGALICDGGADFLKKVYAKEFRARGESGYSAEIVNVFAGRAAFFTDGIRPVQISNGTYAITATGKINAEMGAYYVDGTQVVSSRVIDARLNNTPNSGNATTDDLIDALRDLVLSHGLGAAS